MDLRSLRIIGASLLLIGLGWVRTASAQFSDVHAPGQLQPRQAATLFATWEGRQSIDGLTVQLPDDWQLRGVKALRYGYEPVPLTIRRQENATRTHDVSFAETQHHPFELVVQVRTGSPGGPMRWSFTPFSQQGPARNAMMGQRVTRPIHLAPSPSSPSNQALSLAEDNTPLLLQRQSLPSLDGQEPYTVAAWLRTHSLGEVVLSTWNGEERHPYPFELVVEAGGRLSFYRGGRSQHQALTTTRPVADGRWHHVAVTHDPRRTTTTLWLDGQAADSLRAGGAASNRLPLAVGGRASRSSASSYPDGMTAYSGQLDELVLQPAALAGAALRRLMDAATPNAENGFHLGFEENVPASFLATPRPSLQRVPAERAVSSSAFAQLRADANGEQVELSWTTPNTSAATFYVERSAEGRTFRPIAEMRSEEGTRQGNTLRFRFTDPDVSNQGVVYYRIRRRSEAGQQQRSRVLKIGLGRPEADQAMLVGNSPNPFSTSTTISYRVHQRQHVQLSVWNLSGHKIEQLVDAVQSPDHYEVRFDAGSLPSGTYFARLQTPLRTESHKMTLIQ